MTDGVLFMIDRLIVGSFNPTQDHLILTTARIVWCIDKLDLNKRRVGSSETQMGWLWRSSKEMGFCTKWTPMQWRPDLTRLRQDNQTRRVALWSRALVWQPSSQIKSSEWTDNCPTTKSVTITSKCSALWLIWKKDQTRTRQTGGGGWHCGHALGSNSPPLLHCITLYQYLAWRVYSLWSVHNHLTGYWFTLTKRACIPLGKNLCDSFKYRGNHGNENCQMKGKIFSHFESETTETWVFWKKNAAKACHWFPESGHLWLWSEIKSHFTSASLIPACIQDSFLVGQQELLECFAEKYIWK